MLPLRGASMDLLGTNMSDENLVQVSDYTSGDLNYQFCPLGKDRIRVTGFADFVGETKPDKDFMRKVFVDQTKYLFPNLKWTSETPLWHGFRPMSPDNLPYVGKDCATSNLYVSCGHGSNGWTTSSGTGKLLSGLIQADLGMKHLTDNEKKISELLCPNRFNNFPFPPPKK